MQYLDDNFQGTRVFSGLLLATLVFHVLAILFGAPLLEYSPARQLIHICLVDTSIMPTPPTGVRAGHACGASFYRL